MISFISRLGKGFSGEKLFRFGLSSKYRGFLVIFFNLKLWGKVYILV